MTAEEQIKHITELLNDLNVADMSRAEFCREMRGRSFDELEEDMWRLYCFVDDVCNTLNM